MINDALRKVRLFHEMKQTDLANQLNISKSYLSEIESGKKKITLDLLNKYSDIFDIPTSSLIFFSEQIKQDDLHAFSEKFKNFCMNKILKIMEWNIDKNDKKSKEKD